MSVPALPAPGDRSGRGRIPALLVPLLLAASILAPTSDHRPAFAGPATTTGSSLTVPAEEPISVTLITGDTVTWTDVGDGRPRAEVVPSPRDYPVTFERAGTQEDFYVTPSDAMEHVAAGSLDRELFNIPGLIRQGLHDAARDELPVIVTFDRDDTRQQVERNASALPGISRARALERVVNGVGVAVDRGRAAAFRRTVIGDPTRRPATRHPSPPSLGGGVERIMLDRVLKIELDESAAQIGAPQAWDAGYTGAGVTVAVLDTGVDAGHPDLAGRLVAAENFTDEPHVGDRHGHGTHVASIIAGTGVASGGRYQGIAPDANVLSGKVCNTEGDCLTSWVMAGMEWAAEQGADVVNMSLGGGPTDGSDPLSRLVDELVAETDTLFVISAGNTGPRRQQVGAPGSATAALTVGAVDKSGELPRFSSRGPRVGDHAVKPELSAPGVGIVAARAGGTALGTVVDDRYTAVDGTSMAAPHVAGAAALLAQARPVLAGAALKDALVSTANDIGHRWYEQGAGLVDVPSALGTPVYATGTVNLGGVTDRAEQDIVYTNLTAADIPLALEAVATDVVLAPIDGVSLSADAVTVPAGGQATVTVTVDMTTVSGVEPFGGIVTALGTGVNLRTAIGFGPPMHRVDIEVLDSNGNRIGTDRAHDWQVFLIHDTYDPSNPVGSPDYLVFTSDGIATTHVPSGVFTLMANVLETDPATGSVVRGSVLTELEVSIHDDTAVTLDTRDAVPVKVTVPRTVDKRNHAVTLIRERAKFDGLTFALSAGGATFPVYARPTPPGSLAFLALWVHWTLAEPRPLQPLPWDQRCPQQPVACYSEAPDYVYSLPILYGNGVPDYLHERFTHRDLVQVPTRFHADHNDAFIAHQFAVFPPFFAVGVGGGVGVRMMMRPGRVTEYYLPDDRLTWVRGAFAERRPASGPAGSFTQHSSDRFLSAEAGSRRAEERWFEGPVRIGVPDLRAEFLGNPSGGTGIERPATASRGGSNGDQFVPGAFTMDNSRGHLVDAPVDSASWRLWNLSTGDEVKADFPFTGGSSWLPAFRLGPAPSRYRLEQVEHHVSSTSAWLRTGPATTVWTFASGRSSAGVPLGYRCPLEPLDTCQIQPLIQLEYDLGLDLDNRARAGRAHRFTIVAGHHSQSVDPARVTRLSVEASFDDGETWERARVVGKPRDNFDTGGFLPSARPYQEFRVVLKHAPIYRTTGFVTLRVQALDAYGGAVDQTIHRAYRLK